MKPHNEFDPDRLDPHDDQTDVSEFLSVLQQVKASPEGKAFYHTTVVAELARLVEVSASCVPWWRRSVRVPLPVVIAASALMLISIWSAQSSREKDSEPQVGLPDEKSPGSDSNKTRDLPKENPPHSAPGNEFRMVIQNSGLYVRGIGPLSTETRYVLQEFDQ
ncbi:MAG: hypothetical protein KDB01_08960 [Planctomycetaceae bacterium]|nr:hypothetical protein [Planctomycetaceae bacterium]